MLGDKRNKTGKIRRSDLAGEFHLEVRPGGAKSPILEGDHLRLPGWDETMRVDRHPEKGLGFTIKGKLAEAFQPLSGLVGWEAKRDYGASAAAKATGAR